MAAHTIDDPIWDHFDACDVSIDIVNSAEALAGSHIAEWVPDYILHRSESTEVHTIYTYVTPVRNQDDKLYQFMDKYNKWAESTCTLSASDMGISHTFTEVDKIDSTNKSIKSDFLISKRQS